MNEDWNPSETAPVGVHVLVANASAKWVASGYRDWAGDAGRRCLQWFALEPTSIGRARVTHWKPLPECPA